MLRWLIGRPDQDEVRLPVLKGRYESSVPGLHIVGDLAGAPTIRVAANQGVEVMEHIGSLPDGRAEGGAGDDLFDVVIVGGGSSGIAAALEAKCCQRLKTVVLDARRAANTIREFPKGKEIYDIREGEEVKDMRRGKGGFEVETSKGNVHRGRRVVLAIGKRGNPRKLGVPGEDREKVLYQLYDAEEHRDENVLVVGGGDSAIEAALALAEVARVTLSYRRDGFFRIKPKNREKIEAARAAGELEVIFESDVKEIGEAEVVLDVKGEERRIANDCVLVAAGAELPHKFFKRVGIRMEKEWTWKRWAALLGVTALFWLAYAAKHYPPLFPYPQLEWTWETFQFGKLHWWQWFTLAYSAVVLFWGIKAMRKYWYSKFQRWKYASVIFFQCFMLCILPVFLVPLFAPKWYADAGYAFHLVLAWPLSIKALPAPWAAGHTGPFLYAVGLTFVGIPLLVYFQGSRFCSWICGCGALAETLGDEVRHLAPRGPKSIRFETIAGRTVLVLASILTFATIFFGNWLAAAEGMHLYGIWIDIMLAGAVGVGFYWFMGNRVWCRFFCPLRMYMNLIGRIASRFRIVPSRDKCIACGQCSRECQMGIPVMDFAKQGAPVTLKNSSCIGCGICVDVCPVDVLHWNEEQARAAEPEHMKS